MIFIWILINKINFNFWKTFKNVCLPWNIWMYAQVLMLYIFHSKDLHPKGNTAAVIIHIQNDRVDYFDFSEPYNNSCICQFFGSKTCFIQREDSHLVEPSVWWPLPGGQWGSCGTARFWASGGPPPVSGAWVGGKGRTCCQSDRRVSTDPQYSAQRHQLQEWGIEISYDVRYCGGASITVD